MNVVVVSNRVARAKPDEPLAGGLAAALLPMVRDSGAIWVGSSGQSSSDASQARGSFARIEALGTGALATVDMPAKHYRGFYEGFANSALWPALHSRADLIHVSADDYASYREVNAFMAKALLRFNTPETLFWIQDYHFLMLGADLRRLHAAGVRNDGRHGPIEAPLRAEESGRCAEGECSPRHALGPRGGVPQLHGTCLLSITVL